VRQNWEKDKYGRVRRLPEVRLSMPVGVTRTTEWTGVMDRRKGRIGCRCGLPWCRSSRGQRSGVRPWRRVTRNSSCRENRQANGRCRTWTMTELWQALRSGLAMRHLKEKRLGAMLAALLLPVTRTARSSLLAAAGNTSWWSGGRGIATVDH
jgi:hypothetical protein